ncbi:MAG: hypothetical protein NTY53_05025 [Kiritimatiellaeota bacterium]|nr:hypothetical protein [Kiritimatiellota bacterium]
MIPITQRRLDLEIEAEGLLGRLEDTLMFLLAALVFLLLGKFGVTVKSGKHATWTDSVVVSKSPEATP